MTDKNTHPSKDKKPVKKAKPKKESKKGEVTWEDLILHFSFDKLFKLSEQQFMVLFVVLGVLIGGIYFYLSPDSEIVVRDSLGISADLMQNETAEQKFKRENRNAVLPDGSKIPQQTVVEQTYVEKQIPFGDKQMEFIVRLPKDWVMSNFAKYGLPGEEDYTILTNIARYFGPAIEDARPFFWLEVQKLKRYIPAEAYLRAYMLKNGIVPDVITDKSEKEAEALYIDVRDTRSYAMRTIFRLEGPYIIMASVAVPVQSYNDFKDLMGLIMKSFSLVNPIEGKIEEIVERKLLNVIRLSHYSSWIVRNEKAQTAIKPSLEIHNPQEAKNPEGKLLQGLILVSAWRLRNNFNEQEPVDAIKERLAQLNVTLDPNPVQPPKKITVPIEDMVAEQTEYKALIKQYERNDEFDIIKSEETKTEQEMWMTVLDNGYYRVYLAMLTPPKSTSYITWAKNKAGFDLLVRTIKVRSAPKEE